MDRLFRPDGRHLPLGMGAGSRRELGRISGAVFRSIRPQDREVPGSVYRAKRSAFVRCPRSSRTTRAPGRHLQPSVDTGCKAGRRSCGRLAVHKKGVVRSGTATPPSITREPRRIAPPRRPAGAVLPAKPRWARKSLRVWPRHSLRASVMFVGVEAINRRTSPVAAGLIASLNDSGRAGACDAGRPARGFSGEGSRSCSRRAAGRPAPGGRPRSPSTALPPIAPVCDSSMPWRRRHPVAP